MIIDYLGFTYKALLFYVLAGPSHDDGGMGQASGSGS